MSKDWDRKEDANDYDVGDFGYGYDDHDEPPPGWVDPKEKISDYKKRRCYGYAPVFEMLEHDPDEEVRRCAGDEYAFEYYMASHGYRYRQEEVSEYPPF